MSAPVADAKAAERWVAKTRLEELQGAERPPGHERDTIEARPNKRGSAHYLPRELNSACLSNYASKNRLSMASQLKHDVPVRSV
jgi:hypothetical protein